MNKSLLTSLLLAATVAAGLALLQPANAQGFSVTITVDENGNGTLSNTSPI